MGAPGPFIGGGRLIHPPDPSMDVLAAWGGRRPYRDLPFHGLIGEPVADLELHGKDASCPGRQGWRHARKLRLHGPGLRLLPGPGLAILDHAPSLAQSRAPTRR